MKVLIPIAEGVEDLEIVTMIDVLRRAEINVTVAAVGIDMTITAARGTVITADKLLMVCKNIEFDMIALPGGLPGAEHLRDCKTLEKMLKAQKKSGRWFAAICASPAIVFQEFRLIDDIEATAYPSFLEDLSIPSTARVVVDGKCITSQGPATALTFSLKLVELLCGKDKSLEISNQMLVN